MRVWGKKTTGIIPFSIPQESPEEKLKNIKEKISRFQKDFDYFTDDDKEYIVFSEELKLCLRLEVWERNFDEYKREEHGGEFFDNRYFFYKESISDGDPDIFKIKEELIENKINYPQIVEIDDEEAEKIRQENLERKKKQKEYAERNDFKDYTNLNNKNTKQEIKSDDSEKHKSGSKCIIPLIGSSLFLAIFGIVLAVKKNN